MAAPTSTISIPLQVGGILIPGVLRDTQHPPTTAQERRRSHPRSINLGLPPEREVRLMLIILPINRQRAVVLNSYVSPRHPTPTHNCAGTTKKPARHRRIHQALSPERRERPPNTIPYPPLKAFDRVSVLHSDITDPGPATPLANAAIQSPARAPNGCATAAYPVSTSRKKRQQDLQITQQSTNSNLVCVRVGLRCE